MGTSMDLINSCLECKTVCCKHGPGPHLPLEPETYLENFGEPEAYNTKCIALTDDNECSLWGTPSLPVECRQYVCHVKNYTEEELDTIDDIVERECPNCGCKWQILTAQKGNDWVEECEVCGHRLKWKGIIEKRGKRKLKKRG